MNKVFQFNAFVRDHRLTDYSFINDNKMLLSGEVNNKEKQISKPCQQGAFVTAYSGRIMLTYMKAIDPTLKSSIFTYTDTDSLHITGENYKKLLGLGYIKPKAEAKLGFLCSDIKERVLLPKKST